MLRAFLRSVRVWRKAEHVPHYSAETSATPQSYSYITSRFWVEQRQSERGKGVSLAHCG